MPKVNSSNNSAYYGDDASLTCCVSRKSCRVLLLMLASGCGKSPYDNPIANNSQQPDKILFDKAVENIERHRYELARITLQTLINTYPDSEYIAKAKLAIGRQLVSRGHQRRAGTGRG